MPLSKNRIACSLLVGLLCTPLLATAAPASTSKVPVDVTPMDWQWRQEMRQQHLTRLHEQLKLQPAQEAAWKAFVASMPQKPGPIRQTASAATVVERQAWMLQHMKTQQEVMQKHHEATKAFYDQLSAEQKKSFDTFMTPRPMKRRMGAGMGMGMAQ